MFVRIGGLVVYICISDIKSKVSHILKVQQTLSHDILVIHVPTIMNKTLILDLMGIVQCAN